MSTFRKGAMSRTIAHRGGSQLFPENTLESFSRAHAMGVRTMELDVHLTSDGVLVVHHDPTVDRTTDGQGPIAGMTLAQVATLDAGHGFEDDRRQHPYRGRGIGVPTLEQVVTAFPDVFFVIELKPTGDAIAQAIRRAVDAHKLYERVCVASFDEPTLVRFRSLPGPRARSSGGREVIGRMLAASRLRAETLVHWPFDMLEVPEWHGRIRILDARFAEACHRIGVEVHVWTVDDRSEMERFLDMGVDAIITDRPDRMADLG